MRQYSHRLKVWCASPIFKPIAYKLRFTNRKWKYFEEKTTATLKSKQTSIATVRNHLRTLASFPIPLIFHWSLPLWHMWYSSSKGESTFFSRKIAEMSTSWHRRRIHRDRERPPERGNEAATSGLTSPSDNKKYLLSHCLGFTIEHSAFIPSLFIVLRGIFSKCRNQLLLKTQIILLCLKLTSILKFC